MKKRVGFSATGGVPPAVSITSENRNGQDRPYGEVSGFVLSISGHVRAVMVPSRATSRAPPADSITSERAKMEGPMVNSVVSGSDSAISEHVRTVMGP